MTSLHLLRDATRRCPKRMVYGPCGGVSADGGCEVPGIRCSFAEDPVLLRELDFSAADIQTPDTAHASGDALPPSPRRAAAAALGDLVATAPVITADLPVRTVDPAVVADAGARLGAMTALTAVIAGEPPGLRESLSPTHKALLLVAAGARVISGITCRDRNRVAIEGELAALADLGVSGILAVTGDHPATTALRDADPVFDLDSTRVAALARRAGLFVAVAEQPSAPPVDYRPKRLALKARAGAELGILNLCGDIADIARFTSALATTAAPVPVLVSVPVLTSASSARRLASLPGVNLPPSIVAAALAAPTDPGAGIRAAVDWAGRALGLPGVVGVHLSAVVDDEDASGIAAVDALAAAATAIRDTLRPRTAVLAAPEER
ncbi:MAG: methylenetetrahydrofolate reductase C-terminal domain-containing protein [Microbacterium sp.]|uniref:methylenetetrahydrofolate reductase C-terminal domain-containing protein n=1 Tax=Microbacterium sp. TaxID=51671 RepID=UPI001AC271DF|nr:methylenetetrahydrofolate reductase C-terminal domain-containing protein [Microbacterium sp.]MBN9175790.1 methylenetetrahydrofolate reductase C-terminal domain-containing protein [Microbacterium sp.]